MVGQTCDIGLKDLEHIVPQNVHAVLVPKVESADQINWDNNQWNQDRQRRWYIYHSNHWKHEEF